ncbi:MAG: hypothetical protein OXF01_13940, partial [Gemmatimonadetes bacterium]|nr:hypothetical protein [Gemmatimonadota bacterium]
RNPDARANAVRGLGPRGEGRVGEWIEGGGGGGGRGERVRAAMGMASRKREAEVAGRRVMARAPVAGRSDGRAVGGSCGAVVMSRKSLAGCAADNPGRLDRSRVAA